MIIVSPVAKGISLLFTLIALTSYTVYPGMTSINKPERSITTTSRSMNVSFIPKVTLANQGEQAPSQSTQCFNPQLEVKVKSKAEREGSLTELKTPGVKGGKNYGRVNYEWTASDGQIIGSGKTVKLRMLRGIRSDFVFVQVKAKSDRGNCTASGEARFRPKFPDHPLLPNQPPTVALSLGVVIKRNNDLLRESASTVCPGDRVELRATSSDPDGDAVLYSWTSTGGRVVGDGANTTFDTTGLAPGEYTITVQADSGNGTIAFDSKTIRVANCPPLLVCPSPNLDMYASASSVEVGEKVKIETPGVTGGRNYGTFRYEWTTTAGDISRDGLSAILDTTGVPSGTTIQVTVRAVSEVAVCSASGSGVISVRLTPLPLPLPREMGSCSVNSRNDYRITGSCLGTLEKAVMELNADSGAMLFIQIYRLENEKSHAEQQRARVVSGKLQDGSLGPPIEPNRLRFKYMGVTGSYDLILKVSVYPYGAEPPDGETVAAPARTPGRRSPRPTPPKPKPKGKATKRTSKGRY